jgi:hypothetical protein
VGVHECVSFGLVLGGEGGGLLGGDGINASLLVDLVGAASFVSSGHTAHTVEVGSATRSFSKGKVLEALR